jgi:hypothetical protein
MSKDSKVAKRSCHNCGTDTYKTGLNRRTTCTDQPFCGKGEYITADSKKATRACEPCGPNTYRPSSKHRAMACAEQPKCPAGQRMSEDSKVAKRSCLNCGADTYKTGLNRRTKCTTQPTCVAGQYISKNLKTERRTCTPCSAGSHTSVADQFSCTPCEVNDALDATHVGFAVAQGAKKCTKHRVCTLPTTVNGAGEYETKPARPHHDRECGPLVVAHSYQFISQTETPTSPRIVETCPFNYRATDDFSACYPYRCSHVTCSHLKHKCSKFNTAAQVRAPDEGTTASLGEGTTAALLSHRNECDDTKLFKTTVTLHQRDENTCQNGHWCGMGVVTGDKAKCECAPLNLKPAKVDQGTVNTQGDVGLATYKAASAGFALGGAGYAFAGDYGTKGLYYYTSGTYKNMAFFGTGGTMAQESAPVSPPKARISTSEASYNAALVSHMQDTYAATP